MEFTKSQRETYAAYVDKMRKDGRSSEIVSLSKFITGKEQAVNNPLSIQVAGDHYKSLTIQPVEYIHANNIGFFEGSVIKYVTRWRSKGGVKDLEKAKHFIDLLIELEAKNAKSNPTQTQPLEPRNS